MRLISYADPSSEGAPRWRAGVVRDGEVVDAAGLAQAVEANPQELVSVRGVLGLGDRLGDLARAAQDAQAAGPREAFVVGPPVPDPDKILCIGLNYAAHAEETKLDPSAVPTVFPKFRNALIGSGAPIVVPASARGQVDYEGELAVVIGRRCSRANASDALDHVAGVMPLNDVSARDLQMQTSQWTVGKAVDTFSPCGPELVLLDEVADLHDLGLSTRVNGRVVQDARTSQMIFDVTRIISFVSSVITLEVGDIIATGTPAGVGFTREPPLFLHAGDTVEVEIEGVGRLENTVIDEP